MVRIAKMKKESMRHRSWRHNPGLCMTMLEYTSKRDTELQSFFPKGIDRQIP